MARHDQKPEDRYFVCIGCKNGNCNQCVDILRMVYSDEPICRCKKQSHSGEPRDKQVRDPETGDVFTDNGTRVTKDGEVKLNYNSPLVRAIRRLGKQ